MVLALAGILAVLAVLQYSWIGQISEADRQRLQSHLDTSVEQFRLEFNREMMDVSRAFRRSPGIQAEQDWDYYALAYEDWIQTSFYPELVASLYIREIGEDSISRMAKFNKESGEFEAYNFPERFEGIFMRQGPRRGGPEMRPAQWILSDDTPLLIQPLIQPPIPPLLQPENPAGNPPRPLGFLIIELNLDFIRTKLLPELAGRYFTNTQTLDYYVAVLSGEDPARIIYRSDKTLVAEDFSLSDARISLFREPGQFPDIMAPDRGPAPFRARGLSRGMLLVPRQENDAWELAVKHRQGSLAVEVDRLRSRNLAISFGILLLLGLSTAMIVVYTQRAQRLARLQVEFVAGVSHELRSPLAVICSAGDNLAAGIVGSPEQLKEYGALIRDEGRRLSTMVEQTLQFAAAESGRKRYNLEPVDVGSVIDAAMKEAEPSIQAAGFIAEKKINDHLPPVEADEAALSQCVQNLITNALKYGGANRWVGVSADVFTYKQGIEVRITVEDKGIGIEPSDLPHIFEPFFQGRAAENPKSPGAGLGLSLVKSSIEAMGGSVKVRSMPGEGSSFILHLPALNGGQIKQNGT